MTVRIILGAPASGKTAWLVDYLRGLRGEKRFAPVWLIVPDASKKGYLRKRIGKAGGAVGVNVATFGAIYNELLERSGRFVPIMPPPMDSRIVREVIGQASQNNALDHFSSIKDKPGFVQSLQDAFAELRSGLVLPEDVLTNPVANPAEKEIAWLYGLYLEELAKADWNDQEGLSWLAIEALNANAELASDVRLVGVDGFTAFNTARRTFLKTLARQVGEVVITLPGERGSDREVNRFASAQLELLRSEFDAELLELPRASFLPAHLEQIEKDIFEDSQAVVPRLEEALLLELASPAEEAREALRWIKRKHLREGVALEEMALYVSELELYRPYLSMIGREFDIPLHFIAQENLAKSPAINAIKSFSAFPSDGFLSRDLLAMLNLPYFEFGLSSKQTTRLAEIALAQIIVKGREHWDEAWEFLLEKAQNLELEPDAEEIRTRELQRDEVLYFRERFNWIWQLFADLEGPRTYQGWVNWLRARLDELGFELNLQTQQDHDAYAGLQTIFRNIFLTEQAMGVDEVDQASFFANLQSALASTQFQPSDSNFRIGVFVDQIRSARANRYQCVAILGLNEGSFPVRERTDPFLSEELRASLGLELRLGREQQSIFYQAITRADRDLLLTRSYLNENGEPAEASPYWKAVQDLLPEDGLKQIRPGQNQAQSDAGSLSEMLFWAAQQATLAYPQLPEPAARWERLDKAQSVITARRRAVAWGLYEGELKVDAEELQRSVWSASSFETYASCPYHYFANRVLNLVAVKQPELGLDSAQLGSIYHEVLERVYRAVIRDGRKAEEVVEETARSVFRQAPRIYGFRPSLLWEIEQEQMLELLQKNVAALEANKKDWSPYALEYGFGFGENPPLQMTFGEGEALALRGFVDRIDVNSHGNFRVIDYKSSASISKWDLIKGLRLQLPVYALAVNESSQKGSVVDGFYWSLATQTASSLKLAAFEEGVEDAIQTAMGHVTAIYRRILSGQFQPKPPVGDCPEYCPATRWCWRYQKRVAY